MRYAKQYASGTGFRLSGFKTAVYGALLLGLLPIQAQAQAIEVCNSDVNIYGVDGAPSFFEGDELILNATIGAGMIRDNSRPGAPDGDIPYIDFTGIGYGLDCGGGPMKNLSDCTPVGHGDYSPEESGHDIEFLGVTSTDCVTSTPGIKAIFPLPESDNIVSIPVLNGVVRSFYSPALGQGETCNVDVKFKVNELHESSNWVVQALGVPFNNRTPLDFADDMKGVCSNDLSASGYGKTVFYVNTCEIDVDKQVSLDGENWVQAASAFDGDDVYYRIVLTNMGTAPLVGDVIVNDLILKVSDMPVDADGLKPGEAMVIGGDLIKNFESKAECLTASTVVNTAGVEAVCRVGTEEFLAVTDYMENTAELSCTPRPPSIDLVKTADPLIYSYVEETIAYSFLVTNNGNVPLTDVYVSDPLPGLSDIDCPSAQLAVSEAMTCTATYGISQADLDATVVDNTATAYGTAPDTSKVSDQSSAQIRTTPYYSLALVKTATPLFYEAVGEPITYEYELTNDGNQTLYAPYGVLDDKTTVSCPAGPASLAPGSSVTCDATYLITVADINARSVTNTAQGSALNAPSGGTSVFSNYDDETVEYKGIELAASGFCVNDAPWTQYSFEVFGISGHSPSDVTYTWVNVDDPDNEIVVGGPAAFPAASGYLLWPGAAVSPNVTPVVPPTGPLDPTWPVGTVWPGWELVDGVWVDSDVPETPQLVLRVTINPTDEVLLVYPPATDDCVPAPKALINVDKSVISVTPVGAGSVDVAYKVTVSNNGPQKGMYDLVDTEMVNAAFAPVSVENPVTYLAGTENNLNASVNNVLTASDFVTGAMLVEDEELEAGLNENFTFTLRFSIDELLLTAEGANCVLEDGESRTGLTNHVDVLVGGTIVDDAEACGKLPLTPSIEVLKEILDGEAWLPADTQGTAPVVSYPSGAVYRIKITNTGIVDLVNVVLDDPKVGLLAYVVNGGFLAAGESVTITEFTDPDLTGVLAQEEVCDETEYFLNTGSVTAEGSIEGVGVSDDDDAWLSCVGMPEITVTKYISIDDGETWTSGTAGPVQAPSGGLYKITVENTGQVDLVDVTVDDSRIPGGPYDIGNLAIAAMVTIEEGDWPELRFDAAAEPPNPVCPISGTYQNIATATGTSSENDQDSDEDTDDANLECIGPPMIAILKEVSLDGGTTWHDANEAPYPTAVVDDTADTAVYRISIANIGSVPLSNVLVDDTTLGISNLLIGSLNAGESVYLVPPGVATDPNDPPFGTDSRLSRADICATPGEKPNLASATGESAAGEQDYDDDSAIVDCIGKPAIRILKEVSANGLTWSSTSITTLAPADAYYRITVENIGNVALENVVVSDSILGISDYPVGSMAIGAIVVIAHDDTGDLMLADLHVPGICEGAEEIPNTATADGKSVDSTETVHAEDDAMFTCEVPVDICEESGRPLVLKMQYEGVSIIDHSQGASGVIVPHPVILPSDALLELYDKNELEDTVLKSAGDPFNILGDWTASGKIPPNITIKLFDYEVIKEVVVKGSLLQTITFHGSCSAPLVVGDQFGGVSIIGYTAF